MPRASKPARRHPGQERSKQTVDVILDAAALVLKQVGVKQTTTDRIAARAGLSVGSLYQYFPNKVALYQALMARHFDHITNAAISLSSQLHQASAEEFPAVMAQIMLTPERQDPHLSALLHQIAMQHESVAAIELERTQLVEMAMATILHEKRGVPGFRSDFVPELAGRVLARALAGLVRRTMETEPSLIESDAFASEFRRLIRGYVLE